MEFVEQLKGSIDIVEVIGHYVRLKKMGPRYTGLCPFHTEKTPSFSVHSVHQFYKCFGCGAGGDVVKFVMEADGLTFWEAVKLLAERHGIPMPKRAEYSDPETKLRAAVYRMHEIAVQAYRAALNSTAGAEARGYVGKRGLARETVEAFELGYSDPSGHLLSRAFEREGFTAEQLEASGLVLKSDRGPGYFDRFRGRLMFPIHNEQGKTIAFGGRALAQGQEPKYLNSAETPIYRKSHVLYNLHRAKEAIRKNGRAVMVEGYMDVIGVWAAGVREVVASCGTALTSAQVRAVKRVLHLATSDAPHMVVNYDPDAAGMGATEKSIQILLEESVRVRVLQLEGGLDPDEYVKENGADVYRTALGKAPGYFEWLADRARARFDMNTGEGRIAGLQFLLPAIQRMSDKLERASVADEVAAYLRIERGLVLDNFRKAAAERRDQPLPHEKEPVRAVEQMLLNAVLTSPEAADEIIPRLRRMGAIGQFATRRIFQVLLGMDTQRVRFADLQPRLEEADQDLLAKVLLAGKEEDEERVLEQARAALLRIEQDEREARRTALKTRIRDAERAGMLEEALRITEELGRLDRP